MINLYPDKHHFLTAPYKNLINQKSHKTYASLMAQKIKFIVVNSSPVFRTGTPKITGQIILADFVVLRMV